MRLVLPALVAVLAAAPAGATPLDVRHVPADAGGVLHVDADALRKTSFYKPMLTSAEVGKLDASVQAIVQPMIDSCQSVTIWFTDAPTSKKDDVGKAIVIEFPSGSKLSTKLVAAAAKLVHAKDSGGGHFVGKTDDGPLELMAIGDLVVVSDRADTMTKAIGVLQGKTAAMTEKMLPGGAAGHGVFLFVALGSKLLDDVKKSADSALLKTDITSLAINVGEVGPDLHASASAVMTTADGAQKVKSVVDGLIALVALSDEVKLPRPIDNYVKVKLAGTTVEVEVTFPSAELLKLIQEANTKHP
jgi:hypothetical protein